MEKKMNIKIQLLDYKGTLTHILSRQASYPFYQEDELLVFVEFSEPHPANIISTAITIPVKDYSREEFLQVVKKNGDEQLLTSIENHRQKHERQEAAEQRKVELDAVAKSIESKF